VPRPELSLERRCRPSRRASERRCGDLRLRVIAISPKAFDAIDSTLPLGSVGYEAQLNEKGERQIWVDAAVVDRLTAMRWPGESMSDVILSKELLADNQCRNTRLRRYGGAPLRHTQALSHWRKRMHGGGRISLRQMAHPEKKNTNYNTIIESPAQPPFEYLAPDL
jgi:hypothetical protein